MKLRQIGSSNDVLRRTIFSIYSGLFIFSTVNREFVLFGRIDLRYITICLGFILLFFLLLRRIGKKEHNEKKKNKDSKAKDVIFYALVSLFVWSLVSNISWLWNGLEINTAPWIRQNILLANNLIAVVVYKMNMDILDGEMIKKMMTLSCLILVLSFLLTGFGLRMDQISGSAGTRSIHISSDSSEFSNLFGGNFRVSGYAEDANYASILLVMGVIATICTISFGKVLKIILSFIFLIALGFACSRTVLLSIVLGIMYYAVSYLLRKWTRAKYIFDTMIIVALFVLSFILPRLGFLSSMNTMSTRYSLWGISEETFAKSPVIGNGIGSARSAINMRNDGKWYVQPHSNYWQILTETGIVGAAIFTYLGVVCLNKKDNTRIEKIGVILLLIFGFTFEILQLQIFVYAMYVQNLATRTKKGESNVKKRTIYS